MQTTGPISRNAVLAHLSQDDRDLLTPNLTEVALTPRLSLAAANVSIEHVYFPDSGFASLVTNVGREVPIEVGIVGREGVVNMPVLLGADQSPNDCFVQMPGRAHRMAAGHLRSAMARSPTLATILHLFVHVFMMQTASTVLANGRASIFERLARWLLMARDRAESDVLPLTHEFLSMMLGVRRSGVSTALREFERRGLVSRNRGNIALVDRPGLVALANGYYGPAEAEMLRLFGPPAPS